MPDPTSRPGPSRAHAVQIAGPPTATRTAAVALAAAAMVLSLLPAPQAATRAARWLVDVAAALPTGAEVLQVLPVADAVVVSSPVRPAGGVPLEAPLRPQSLLAEPLPSGEVVDSAVATVGAPEVWPDTRGRRAVVALVDTGVAPVRALDGAVAGEIDFSGTGGGDGHGHGTFLASVIAGRGAAASGTGGSVLGVAPGAGVLSLKVADAQGRATLGAVLSALQWLHGPGQAAGIRVAAMALAVEPGTEAAALLDRAVDRLARAGVLVVTAAGNDGPGRLASPATSVGSLSVGALDDAGTADRADDAVAAFSASGLDAAGAAQPDLAAPGVAVTGALPAGSVVAGAATPVGEGLYRGSGTSMATAVVAGVAALASSARPDLDGRALAEALRAGAAGPLAPAAVAAALAADPAPGRGGQPVSGPGRGPETTSVRWTSIRWTSIRWTGAGWGDAEWPAAAWGSIRWTGSSWAYTGPQPQSIRWTSLRWTLVL
jgi:serine protease AprX